MPRDPDVIVDRDRERAHLQALLDRASPQLVLMYGRRRVGKTYLLNRVWPTERSFYFTAAETTPSQNREALLAAFAEWSGQAVRVEDYSTWRTVFRLLMEHGSPDPLTITIDEFQYLGESEKDLVGVASELNAVWEMRRAPRPLVFVVAGSAVRTLESMNAGGSPLYGRFAWVHQLRPFDYFDAAVLAGFEDLRDRVYAYAVFGGTPRYLTEIDPDLSIAENIQAQMLAPTGEVRELVRTALLQEQGFRDIPKYTAILRAIGNGRTLINDIAQAAGLDLDTAFRDKLERLAAFDYVKQSRNLGAKSREPYRYRVLDPAFRFFYEFVAPWESMLATQSAPAVWDTLVAPRLDTYTGMIFEHLVEEAYYRLQSSRQLPLVKEWGRWEGVDRHRSSLEMDIASELADGRVLTGAIKWNARPMDVAVHNAHLGMIERLADSGVEWANRARDADAPLLYVCASGFTEEFERIVRTSRPNTYLWSLHDLYSDEAARRQD